MNFFHWRVISVFKGFLLLSFRLCLGTFIYVYSISFIVEAQDWRLLRHSHNAETCSTCQANLNSIGIDLPLWQGRILRNYGTNQSNFLEDYIEYRNPDGSTKTVAIKELSTFELPQKLTLHDGSKVDLANFGAIDDSTISIEGSYAPTPNQVVQKQVPLPLIRLSNESRDAISRMLGRFTINGMNYIGFVTGVDQRREHFTLRYGEYGIVRNFPYSSVKEGTSLIDRLHRDHFLGLKKIGLNLFKMKEEAYFTLHQTNPVDYEEEIRKEEESLKQRELVAKQNLKIREQYERDLAYALRYGRSQYSVPSPNYIDMPPLYLAHPEWSDIAGVYQSVREYLEKEYFNWERAIRLFPSVPLKTPEEKNFAIRRKMAMGSETIEGYYKVKVSKGEFKLYILPNGAGRCVIKLNKRVYKRNGDVDSYKRSNYECSFSYRLEKSSDLSYEILRVSGVRVKHSNRDVSAIDGSKLSDYQIQFQDGKIRVFEKARGTQLEVERLTSVVIQPTKISAITPPPYALSHQEKVVMRIASQKRNPFRSKSRDWERSYWIGINCN